MDIDLFDYPLPESLIAQFPTRHRSDSRLMVLNGETGTVEDLEFNALPRLLAPGDLLVFNDTKVIPARLFGRKETGGRIEVLVERVLGEDTILAQMRASKTPKPGQTLHIEVCSDEAPARILERQGIFFVIQFDDARAMQVMAEGGHMPLPPYIARVDEALDRERYQTVYARRPGAVAAPTAGLHFDRDCLEELQARGVSCTHLTLHVGAGTFAPMRVRDVHEHTMHQEWFEVPQSVCDAVAAATARDGRIVAVGTTSVRALESAARGGVLRPFAGETDLFIYPGGRFAVVDAMVTNFHLPRSTLLMLVCAFAGTEQTLNAYRHAVDRNYRFFSYGDAMFVLPRNGARGS